MADYLDKWKTDFPETINNQTRPTEGIDNSLAFNTDGFPQRITNDPVHAKLENDMASQLFSNDERLKEMSDTVNMNLDAHNRNAWDHANGISGKSTGLKTGRNLKVNLESPYSAVFDGTADAMGIGVSGILPVANGGTGKRNLGEVNVGSATKLATPRSINVLGTGLTGTAKSFDGSGNITIPITLVNSLLAMAGVTPSADKLPFFTGASSADLTTLSAFARTILDDTSAEAVRNTIAANAATCGGIVAQSLTQNGYVKWANGFIIQWIHDKQSSDIAVDSYDVNIPIAMNILGISFAGTMDDQTNIIAYSDTTITVRTLQSQLTDPTHRVKRPFFAILVGVA